ncbi:lysozyme g-like [Pseudorasbora parva]|uniref:lysozyme g-like n=1 Tax=Pseudorasbora parva TaxID=51549 RepID=UPI00351F0D37
MKINTTGASEKTARQDKLTVKGVEASKQMAEHDLARLEKYKNMIIKVGRAKKMDPAVIAAIISRETRVGTLLKDGWNTAHTAFGLMQVDSTQGHKPVGTWDSEEHVTQATEILIRFIKEIRGNKEKFSQWTQEQCFKGGIAAYNKGVSRVSAQYDKIDEITSGLDYSNDVVARAQWFRSKGY